ncbi:uncharacterized protein LOC103315450 [Nasonia vitripennis]|uniref:ATP-dependent DNA helicase n=1 Tax=Nasonia vitripennis TaxID=7425 RepID=A0A7M7LQB7_NASVI|nr:uncharacterized protein LOC103315450 [Nasonia vitripennis]
MPKQLRSLFVRILMYCNPLEPNQLWEDFKDCMSEDFSRRHSKEDAYFKALIDIQSILQCEDYLNIGHQRMNKLNEKQKIIANKVLNAVMNGNCDNLTENDTCFFIDGPGGSGKTFVYETLWYILNGNNKNVCMMAFTGIAATLLPKELKEAAYLKSIDVFIWDEAPMAPRYAIEIMDRCLRDIMNNDKLFGGKIIVLGGDFRRLLPIKVHGTHSETIDLSINRSLNWNKFVKFSLTQNMRALPQEIQFAKFLLNVGDGKLNDSDDVLNIDYFPPNCIIPPEVDIVDDIYGNIFAKKEYRKSINYAILSRRQFPIKIAFTMTINKAQGQTFEKIGIDLRREVFNHGQLYVALSRIFMLQEKHPI